MAGIGWLNRRRNLGRRHLRWQLAEQPGPDVVFLYRDQYVSAASAPLASPRTCEPGPGSMTIVDTGNTLGISGGALNWPAYTGAGDPRLYTEPIARACGLGVFEDLSGVNQRYRFGWADTNAAAPDHLAFRGVASAYASVLIGGVAVNVYPPFNVPVMGIILRASGAWFVVKQGGGWILLYVENSISGDLSAGHGVDTTAGYQTDNFKVAQLPAPWTGEYGVATARAASPSAGETLAMEADGLVEFTWTAVSGETLEIMVRRTDDDNCWILRCVQVTGSIRLVEKEAGSETERASDTQTFTNGQPYRFIVVCDTQEIRVYVNNLYKMVYSPAAFNQSATGVKVDQAGTELISWPRYLSGAALAALEAA